MPSGLSVLAVSRRRYDLVLLDQRARKNISSQATPAALITSLWLRRTRQTFRVGQPMGALPGWVPITGGSDNRSYRPSAAASDSGADNLTRTGVFQVVLALFKQL